ncbi:hypothetical protein DSUL_100196 [Desulfovibrionales bacterium]
MAVKDFDEKQSNESIIFFVALVLYNSLIQPLTRNVKQIDLDALRYFRLIHCHKLY